MPSSSSELSQADRFKLLDRIEREARLAGMTDAEIRSLRYDWEWWRRPSQAIPGPTANPKTADGSWVTWFPKAGRGWGKTRVGAETTRIWVRDFPLVNLIGATADDARDIMIEGESGILAICPKRERPIYRASKRRLEWPNGAKSLIFTADEPERLRGKQHMKVWCDEVAAWRYPEAWEQLELGLRLGTSPQAVATSTPKPTKLIKGILAMPETLVTHGTTMENRGNLSPVFLNKIIAKYQGTRLGRQELEAEVLDDNPGALWKRSDIEDTRVIQAPGLRRIIVAADPAVSSDPNSDETGIVIAGVDGQNPPHFYVLGDRSGIFTPDDWAKILVMAYRDHRADRIVGEVNNGGDLVEAVIRNVTIDGKPAGRDVRYKKVHASRGKQVRAEPIAGLYEQNRVHHVGIFSILEDQMADWDPSDSTSKSPDRVDALVWALTELSEGPAPMVINPAILKTAAMGGGR